MSAFAIPYLDQLFSPPGITTFAITVMGILAAGALLVIFKTEIEALEDSTPIAVSMRHTEYCPPPPPPEPHGTYGTIPAIFEGLPPDFSWNAHRELRTCVHERTAEARRQALAPMGPQERMYHRANSNMLAVLSGKWFSQDIGRSQSSRVQLTLRELIFCVRSFFPKVDMHANLPLLRELTMAEYIERGVEKRLARPVTILYCPDNRNVERREFEMPPNQWFVDLPVDMQAQL